jgi:hypothetical protein
MESPYHKHYVKSSSQSYKLLWTLKKNYFDTKKEGNTKTHKILNYLLQTKMFYANPKLHLDNEKTHSLGIIMVGVHKRNVSPQNHSQKTTLNDHYVH